MKKIAIIDYGSGNLRSAAKAFEHVSQKLYKQAEVIVTKDPLDLREASHIVLPGVGAFGDCMHGLSSIPGMIKTMHEEVRESEKPFLGICVGMQLLADVGHEYGEHAGLGWIRGEVIKIEPKDAKLPVPHMGWNTLDIVKKKPHLLDDINSDVYFVHSYHFVPSDNENLLATTSYGSPITAAIASGNIMGVQFHPEKSQQAGLQLIENFLRMKHAA